MSASDGSALTRARDGRFFAATEEDFVFVVAVWPALDFAALVDFLAGKTIAAFSEEMPRDASAAPAADFTSEEVSFLVFLGTVI